MAEELELLVSSSKYEARITMLEGYLSDLQGLANEYEALKSSAPQRVIGGDQMSDMQQAVEDNIKKVNKAIEAAQASIEAVRHTEQTMSNAGQNATSIIQDSMGIANSLFT